MRKGFDGLAAIVQTGLALDPYGGALFLFRGRRGDLVKALHWAERPKVPRAKLVEWSWRVGRACACMPSGWNWPGRGLGRKAPSA